MKKIVSILLALCMVFSLSVTAFAKEECHCGHTPVIYVPGFGASIYEYTDTGATRIYEPTPEAMNEAKPVIIRAALALLTLRYRRFATLAMEAAEMLLGKISCDKEGKPIYNTGLPPQYLPTVDVHGQYRERFGDYQFNYDWRLDPVDNAKLLATFVQRVKELTGHDSISFSCFSMGNTVVASYLRLYGSDNIEKIAFMSPAYQGLSILGSLMSGEHVIIHKSRELRLFADCMLRDMNMDKKLITLVNVLGYAGAFQPILALLQGALTFQFNRVYDECLRGMFGHMPGIWAFVPDSYYERAKAFTFGDDPSYAALAEKVNFYHNEVQVKVPELLEEARTNGVEIIIACGYGMSTMPLSKTHTTQSDMLIDTTYMSLGATCAPYGAKLKDAQKVADGHDHVSPEKTVDASTCLYPEYTWFVRDQLHFEQKEEFAAFIRWALEFDGQPTVHTNAQYPQYMIADTNYHLSPNTK